MLKKASAPIDPLTIPPLSFTDRVLQLHPLPAELQRHAPLHLRHVRLPAKMHLRGKRVSVCVSVCSCVFSLIVMVSQL